MSESVVRFVRNAVGPDAGGPSDTELVKRFAATRDGGAFELLVWRHAGMVRAAARAVVRDHHLAEDAAQAAFLALAKKAAVVRGNPAGWLYRVARRAAARQRRLVERYVPVDGVTRVEYRPTCPDEYADLHLELASLPDRYRLPLLLCFAEGLSHADAAARLGWPVGTVASRIARAKALLRPRLVRRGLAPSLAALAVVGDGPFAAATARAAVAFAAGESAGLRPAVVSLANGALRAMTVAKLKLVAGVVLACGVVSAGGVWAGGQRPNHAGPNPETRPTPAGGAAARPVTPLTKLGETPSGSRVTVDVFVREVRPGRSLTRPGPPFDGPNDLLLSGVVSADAADDVQIAMTEAARPDWAAWLRQPGPHEGRYLRKRVRATGMLRWVDRPVQPAARVYEVTVVDPAAVVADPPAPAHEPVDLGPDPPGPDGTPLEGRAQTRALLNECVVYLDILKEHVRVQDLWLERGRPAASAVRIKEFRRVVRDLHQRMNEVDHVWEPKK